VLAFCIRGRRVVPDTVYARLFRNEHERLLHAGPQALLSAIREKFWPLNGRNIARRTVHQFITCFRSKPVTYDPKMGGLPRDRIEPERAFKICGVDFVGPIMIKDSLTDDKGIYLRIRLFRDQSCTRRVGRRSNYQRFFSRFTKILLATRNV